MLKKKGSVERKNLLDDIRSDFNKREGNRNAGGERVEWYKAAAPTKGQKEARSHVRILPRWNTKSQHFYHAGGLHFGFSIGGRNRALACPEATVSEKHHGPCPICKFCAGISRSGNQAMIKRLLQSKQSISLQRKYWVNVLDRDDDNKIKVWGANMSLIQHILDSSEGLSGLGIVDPTKGKDITVIRTGSFSKYRYVTANKRTAADYDPASLYKLDRVVEEWMDEAQMIEILMANYGEEVEEIGIRFKGVKKKSSKKVVDDDEEVVDEEDEEVTDEDAEEDSEDDEDTSNDEDEEDEDEE